MKGTRHKNRIVKRRFSSFFHRSPAHIKFELEGNEKKSFREKFKYTLNSEIGKTVNKIFAVKLKSHYASRKQKQKRKCIDARMNIHDGNCFGVPRGRGERKTDDKKVKISEKEVFLLAENLLHRSGDYQAPIAQKYFTNLYGHMKGISRLLIVSLQSSFFRRNLI